MGKASKDKRDMYYRKAKEEGWRARSAFKLMHIDESFDIFRDVRDVVDLCAAPGSWSQVLSRKLYLPALAAGVREEDLPKIVAIDLQPMAPIEGVTTIQGDVTSMDKVREVLSHFDGKRVDLIVGDGAPDVTGLHDLDEFMQAQLILAGLTVATHALKPGGTFIAKIFRGKDVSLLYSQLKIFFPEVTCAKPKSSRNSSIGARRSIRRRRARAGETRAAAAATPTTDPRLRRVRRRAEAFIVCRGYAPPDGFQPSHLTRVLEERAIAHGAGDNGAAIGTASWPDRVLVPFLACGSLGGYDADQSYALDDTKARLDPVQPPTTPAYKTAIELLKKK